MHWLIIETGSNQSYIFAANKQRLQVAASATIWQLGYEWLPEIIEDEAAHLAEEQGSPVQIGTWEGTQPSFLAKQNRRNAQQDSSRVSYFPLSKWNKVSAIDASDNVILHVVKASGKAELLVPSREVGRRIIRAVTIKALISGANIDVWGYFGDDSLQAADSVEAFCEVRKRAVEGLNKQRYKRLSPAMRNARLPFHQPCQYYGEPAESYASEAKSSGLYARGSKADYLFESSNEARERLLGAMRTSLPDVGGKAGVSTDFFDYLNHFVVGRKDLSKGVSGDWVAVVHADGNGIGSVFTRFNDPEFVEFSSDDAGQAISKLGEISTLLEKITWEAVTTAAVETIADIVNRHGEADDADGSSLMHKLSDKMLPILVGGDDIILVLSADIALDFVHRLVQVFSEPQVNNVGPINELITIAVELQGDELSENSPGSLNENQIAKQLSLAAGLLYTKPKHPFHHAVSVAEELTSAAKNKTRNCGSVAPHVIYESALRDLDELCADQSVDGRCYLANPLEIPTRSETRAGKAAQRGDTQTVVGTIGELQTMLQEVTGKAGLSSVTLAKLRSAITNSWSVKAAADRFKAIREQDEHVGCLSWIQKSPLINAIAIDSASGSAFYQNESPTSFITALEIADVARMK